MMCRLYTLDLSYLYSVDNDVRGGRVLNAFQEPRPEPAMTCFTKGSEAEGLKPL